MLYRGPFAAQEKCGLKGGSWVVWSATAADALEKDLSDATVEAYFSFQVWKAIPPTFLLTSLPEKKCRRGGSGRWTIASVIIVGHGNEANTHPLLYLLAILHYPHPLSSLQLVLIDYLVSQPFIPESLKITCFSVQVVECVCFLLIRWGST